MDLRLTTIATFCTPEDAEVARLVLEGNGIECFQEGASTIGFVGYLGNAAGWIKLQVPQADVPRARQLLSRQLPKGEGDSPIGCPKCNQIVPGGYEICWACQSPLDAAAKPILSTLEAGDDEGPDSPTAAGDASAWRAFVAAVIGLFICPPLLNFYSGWILLQIAFDSPPLSRKGNRYFWLAMVIDVAVCALVGYCSSLLFSRTLVEPY